MLQLGNGELMDLGLNDEMIDYIRNNNFTINKVITNGDILINGEWIGTRYDLVDWLKEKM